MATQHPSLAAYTGLRLLTSDELRVWDALVQESAQGSVFCRAWWLGAVCKNPQVLGSFENGRLVAGIPICFERRFGIKICTMPRLTQTWGVAMQPIYGSTAHVLSREMEILSRFADRLSRLKYFDQRVHPNLKNWLPFHWKGFTETSRITYVLDDLDCSSLWQRMHPNARRQISKAQKLGIEVYPASHNELWNMVVKSFARRSRGIGYSKQHLERICSAAASNHQGECFAARDKQGRTHAAGFLVWDQKRAYYLVSGMDPAFHSSSAASLLTWHIIRFAAERTSVFDFEGSMLQGPERFFRGFGAKQVPYHWVMKFPLWVHVYLRYSKTI
jgi:hypothetical protein